jgi:peptidoglycan-associated lipoprotein
MGLTKDHSLIIFQRRLIMIKKSYSILILILCVGLIMTGCPKKTVMKEEASSMKSEELARETEQKEMEGVKTKEVEPSKVQEKEFEKSLVAKAEPGIEGEVLESKLLEDIHFDFDKYDIRPGDAEILKENAALLVKFSNTKIQIEGHCDERGTIEYNLALGERRANHAKKYLVSLGIPENRLSTISYGKERPLDPGHNEEAWAKNRRAHFIILSK